MPHPNPLILRRDAVLLTGLMQVYGSQAEASEKIPEQWRSFMALDSSQIQNATEFYGASPCMGDHKIHYLCGVAGDSLEGVADTEQLLLAAGDYAIVPIENASVLRATWGWMLDEWLPGSGYTEQECPEFERFARAGEPDVPGKPIEIGIPVVRNKP